MKKKVYYLFGLTCAAGIIALYGISSALAEGSKENAKDKKGWTSFFKDKLDASKKTATENKKDSKDKKGLLDFFSDKQEPSKKTAAGNTGQGGGGGGSVSGSATSAPISGNALRASSIQDLPVNVVHVPRPEANPVVGGAAINPIVRVERPVTINTNAPAGPPRPERPSADLRPNEDRGTGR